MSGLGFKFLSTHENVHANLTNDHVTFLIISCAVSSLLPTWYCQNSSDVSNFIEENKEDILGTFYKAGWMDCECFQVYTI